MKDTRGKEVKEAQDAVSYYQNLLSDPSQNWPLGLFMAKQWLQMLQSETLDMEQIRLFALALRSEVRSGGSQWHSMTVSIENWLASLERDIHRHT